MANGNGKEPDYVVVGRAKVNGEQRRWTGQIGRAYNAVAKSGKPYIRLQLVAVPLNFDGTLVLHPAREREPGEDDEPEY